VTRVVGVPFVAVRRFSGEHRQRVLIVEPD
jgi:hypothetical protein